MKDIAYLIITIRKSVTLSCCIKAINENSNGLKYDIHVLLNGLSEKNAQDFYKEFKNHDNIFFYRTDNNLYCAGGRNHLENKVKGKPYKYVITLDDDMKVLENSPIELFKFMEKNINVGICGGMFNTPTNPRYKCGADIDESQSYFALKSIAPGFKGFKEATLVPGGFYIMRMNLINQGVMNDKNIIYGYSDLDLPLSVKKAGYKTGVLSSAKGIHRDMPVDSFFDGFKRKIGAVWQILESL